MTNSGIISIESRSHRCIGGWLRAIAPMAPCNDVNQKPSAKVTTTAMAMIAGHPARNCVPEADVPATGTEGSPELAAGRTAPAEGNSMSVMARTPYGVISQPNIIAWSSWARLWQ